MSCSTVIPQRAGPARQFLLGGAALLALAGSALAETPIKAEKVSRTLIVSDSVQRAGSRISGGWREHAADGSWRRVEFVLDREAATVTFGDGEPGRRPPGVTRYVYAGPGGKQAKTGEAPAVYSEAHAFADAGPEFRDKANRSSLVPAVIATRIRELGGDIKLMQQAVDLKRLSELGSAFDAAGGARDAGGFFADRPGGAPRRSGGGWKDPRAGVGRDGRASDSPGGKAPGNDVVESTDERTGTDGSSESHVVVRHSNGSTTTTDTRTDGEGTGSSTTERNKDGEVTGGTSSETRSSPATVTEIKFTRDPSTGQIHYQSRTWDDSGVRTRSGVHGGTPPETGGSSRGGFDEAWMDKSLPWFMDAVYVEWRRKNDLVKSGGRVAQPGRGEDPSPGTSEGPRVGASAVTNCGDSNTNPCAGAENAETDTRGRLGALTQPPRDVPTGGPVPMPIPGPGPNPQLKP